MVVLASRAKIGIKKNNSKGLAANRHACPAQRRETFELLPTADSTTWRAGSRGTW